MVWATPQVLVKGSAMPICALVRLHKNAKYSILRHHWLARPQSRQGNNRRAEPLVGSLACTGANSQQWSAGVRAGERLWRVRGLYRTRQRPCKWLLQSSKSFFLLSIFLLGFPYLSNSLIHLNIIVGPVPQQKTIY